MIHALIVKKVPGSLDTLLQQGANPDVMSISQLEEEKVREVKIEGRLFWFTYLSIYRFHLVT